MHYVLTSIIVVGGLLTEMPLISPVAGLRGGAEACPFVGTFTDSPTEANMHFTQPTAVMSGVGLPPHAGRQSEFHLHRGRLHVWTRATHHASPDTLTYILLLRSKALLNGYASSALHTHLISII